MQPASASCGVARATRVAAASASITLRCILSVERAQRGRRSLPAAARSINTRIHGVCKNGVFFPPWHTSHPFVDRPFHHPKDAKLFSQPMREAKPAFPRKRSGVDENVLVVFRGVGQKYTDTSLFFGFVNRRRSRRHLKQIAGTRRRRQLHFFSPQPLSSSQRLLVRRSTKYSPSVTISFQLSFPVCWPEGSGGVRFFVASGCAPHARLGNALFDKKAYKVGQGKGLAHTSKYPILVSKKPVGSKT